MKIDGSVGFWTGNSHAAPREDMWMKGCMRSSCRGSGRMRTLWAGVQAAEEAKKSLADAVVTNPCCAVTQPPQRDLTTRPCALNDG